jgi:heparanase 1
MYANPGVNTVQLRVENLPNVPRNEYILTGEGGNVNSSIMQLNGVPLLLTANGTLPNLTPKYITTGSIVLPGHSYGFFEFPGVKVAACQ